MTTSASQQPGHSQYNEVNKNKLVKAGQYPDGRPIFLEKKAFAAFQKMKDDAFREDVSLVILSGFRSIAYQKNLFNNAVKKYGSHDEAARHVAPAGYSEHHTGTAVDIGDGSQPQTNLRLSFERSKSFQWLIIHAKHYGFYLSFPKNNSSGISYEPWHWRHSSH